MFERVRNNSQYAIPDDPELSPIVVNMQFFADCKTALPQWRLILGDNPTVLFVAAR